METQSKGSRGRRARFLQIALNTHLQRLPNLTVDGRFGPQTEAAVRDFQKFAGVPIDGIAGAETWKALLRPAKIPSPNLLKFKRELGTSSDFVEHVRILEGTHKDQKQLFEALANFHNTAGGARYLLTARTPGIIDFRHFFAGAAQAYCAAVSRRLGVPGAAGRGNALLLGVANELMQCVDEATHRKMNSCFAREDLGSNRLGAEFGKLVIIRKAEASRESVSQLLSGYLVRVAPQPPKAIADVALSGAPAVLAETIAAIVLGLLDAIVPEAY
jgi:hypothetical protein